MPQPLDHHCSGSCHSLLCNPCSSTHSHLIVITLLVLVYKRETGICRWLSSGMFHCVVWQKFTNALKVLAASIICSDGGCSKHLWNVGNFHQTTWCNIPEDSHETLKSYLEIMWKEWTLTRTRCDTRHFVHTVNILSFINEDDRNDISLLLLFVITALRLNCKDAHPTKLLKQASLTLLRTLSICCGINADQVQPSSTKIFCSLLRDIIQVSKL